MKITYKGDYALKTILDLAVHYGNGPVTIHDIAERSDAPVKFLEQILLDLKKGGSVESRRGKVGGYVLAKHPADIRLGDVMRFMDGPTEPIACTDKKYTGCNDLYKCVFRGVWKEVSWAISNIIDNITFEDLVNKINKQGKNSLYYI